MKQKTFGKTIDGLQFPVATKLKVNEDKKSYEILIWVSSFFNVTLMPVLQSFIERRSESAQILSK